MLDNQSAQPWFCPHAAADNRPYHCCKTFWLNSFILKVMKKIISIFHQKTHLAFSYPIYLLVKNACFWKRQSRKIFFEAYCVIIIKAKPFIDLFLTLIYSVRVKRAHQPHVLEFESVFKMAIISICNWKVIQSHIALVVTIVTLCHKLFF